MRYEPILGLPGWFCGNESDTGLISDPGKPHVLGSN